MAINFIGNSPPDERGGAVPAGSAVGVVAAWRKLFHVTRPQPRRHVAAGRLFFSGDLQRLAELDLVGEPSRSGNRDYLIKRLAWRLQSLAEGTLSERARKRAVERARDADVRTTMPRAPKAAAVTTVTLAAPVKRDPRLPPPGTVLTRDYRGKSIRVTVLSSGFEWDGAVHSSLSAVAKAITGSHWNGRLFFGLKGRP